MQDTVRFCPQCGSASVDFSSLVGGRATCNGCHWAGAVDELLVVPIEHDFLGKESILIEMINDMRRMLSGELGLPWLKFLLKWGFVQGDLDNLVGTLDRKKFARYLAVIGNAVVIALITERSRQSQAQAQEGKVGGDTTQ